MAYLFFVDESGHDRRESPYEVLAGIGVEDRNLWKLIQVIHEGEERFFGRRVSHDHEGELELKGMKLLKRKVFKHAACCASFGDTERVQHALACINEGVAAKAEKRDTVVTREMLAGLAQAKLKFVEFILQQLATYETHVFASIVPVDAPRPAPGEFLRKDYAYLFERFFNFLDEQPWQRSQGLVVFDELDKVRSHVLVNRMKSYFLETATGRHRASRVVPEPFFVHSDLTTLVQVADIVAYITAWGVRVGRMERERRAELEPFARAVCDLRHKAVTYRAGEPFTIWSFAVIDDLRPRQERDENAGAA